MKENTTGSIVNLIKWLTVMFLSLAILGVVAFGFVTFFGEENDQEVNVNIDKTVLVERVQELSRLQTTAQTYQRDVEITVDLGDFSLFNTRLLENKRTQKVAITGTVFAGIDLDKLTDEDIEVVDGSIKILLPEPEVFNASLIEDKTTILKDDLTLLFKLQDFVNNDSRREVNETLQRQVITQSNQAMVDAACTDDILVTAGENGVQSITALLADLDYENLEVSFRSASECVLN